MGKSGKPGKPKQQHKVKVLHPSSRKASKITGSCMRKQRIQKVHTGTALKQMLQIEKLQWFKDNMDINKDSYSKADMAQLVQSYLQRFDDELEQIAIIHGMKSRKNRQHASREDIIKMTMQREREAFMTSGIEMPDLSDQKNFEHFLNWDGTSKHANLITIKSIKSSDALTSTEKPITMDREDANKNEDEDLEDEKDLEKMKETMNDSNEVGDERTNQMDVEIEPVS